MAYGTDKSQRVILGTMAGTVAMVYAARVLGVSTEGIANPGSMLRIALGGAGATLILLLLAYPEPGVAQLLAILVLIGTFYEYGVFLIEKLIGNLDLTTWGRQGLNVVEKGQAKTPAEGKPLATKPATAIVSSNATAIGHLPGSLPL